MATIYYKRLFQVRILLEYYLRDNIHQEVFAPANPGLEPLLQQRIAHNQYNVWKDIEITHVEATEEILNNRYLRLIKRPDGFFVGIKVTPVNNRFSPFISMEEGVRFRFALTLKNHFFKNLINSSLSNSLPARYYFSNSNADNTLTFPFLSSPIPTFQAGKTYEMGDLAVIGGKLKEAIVKTSNSAASDWREINDAGLAHEGDKLLLPKRFVYSFAPEINENAVEFTIQTTGGTVVKELSFNSPDRLSQLSLDFNQMDDTTEIADGYYNLTVSGSGGYQETQKVFLSNEMYGSGNFGLVDISLGKDDFRLLEADGSLRDPPPVFDIRLKSRSTYWRYKSNQGKKLKLTDKTTPYLTGAGDALQSQDPKPLSFMPVEFRKNDPAVERVFLPNPPNVAFQPETDGRLYSDIYLSPIKGLIEEDV